MPTYVLLSTLTPEGRRTLHSNPDRLEEVNKEIETFGCTIRASMLCWAPMTLSALLRQTTTRRLRIWL